MNTRATDPITLALLALLADAHVESMAAKIAHAEATLTLAHDDPERDRLLDMTAATDGAASYLASEIAYYVGADYPPCDHPPTTTGSAKLLHARCSEALESIYRRAWRAIHTARGNLSTPEELASLLGADVPGAP